MAYTGLQWQKLELPFASGLAQTFDDRARPQPFLDICRDAQFDETNGLQPRFPYAVESGNIFGGGSLANCRRLAVVNDELCVFTRDSLYSWNAQLSAWVLRGTHLACAVSETPRFNTSGDQIDGDRAELSGTIIYAWVEGAVVYAAALDKVTSSVLVSPTAVSTAVARPRLVALATKILLFVAAGANNLTVRAIDPASPGTGIAGAGTSVAAGTFNTAGYYDVVKVDSQDLAVGIYQRVTTTSYTVFTVTPALVVATSTKARTADGGVAVSTVPGGGLQIQVVRSSGTTLKGDVLTTSTLADVTINQAVSATSGAANLAICHRSVTTGGAYRCYVFWGGASDATSSSTGVSSHVTYVDSAGAIGATSQFTVDLGIASRAFDCNGSVYVWLVFAGETTFNSSGPVNPFLSLQNTYFLYRDDGFLCAKTLADHAGGFRAATGTLPGITAVSATSFAWCGLQRRRFEAGTAGHAGFAARAPVDVAFDLDSNAARRCARIGRTLYIAAGEVLQYDGTRLVEVGFHVFPWIMSFIDAGGGSVAPGTYGYKQGWRYQNAQAEIERSTTSIVGSCTIGGSSASFVNPTGGLTVTHKTTVPAVVEFWRTLINPNADSPFYLISSNDPTALVGANRFVPNSPTTGDVSTFNDFLADATIAGNETNPENGAVLEMLAPPPASIVIATDTRLFLAGVAGDPDRVWPSRLRGDGEIASFNDSLPFSVPRGGGAITSIAFLNETLFVFRETAIYAFAGPGFDNTGGGQSYQLLRTVASDMGAVSHEAVARTPAGLLFKSNKGWQLLLDNGNIEPVGDRVTDFDADTVYSIDVVEAQYQVRILTNARMIVWDYRVNQWGEWTITDGVHSVMWRGRHVYLTATGPKIQDTAYTSLTYGLDVETTWIKLAGLQGATRCRRLQPLGEYRSAHLLWFRIAYNYDSTYVDSKAWNPTPAVAGGPLQVSHGPKRPACEAIKLRLTAVTADDNARFATDTDLTAAVSTLSETGIWDTHILALAAGELGNALTISVAFVLGAPAVDVRDNLRWSRSAGEWQQAPNNFGIKVTLNTNDPSPTVTQIEATIDSMSGLCSVVIADPDPSGIDASSALALGEVTGIFHGGTFAAPSGEALKLTNLGLEVGTEPGLYRRLAAAQQQ